MAPGLSHLWYFLKIFLVGYVVFVAILYLLQDFLVFFPQRMTEERWRAVAQELKGELLTVQGFDSTPLRGWFLPGDGAGKRPTVLCYGGNAMPLETFAFQVGRLRRKGINVVLVDYRGYGQSEGRPSAEALKRDSEAAYDAVAMREDVDPSRIFAWGYSIGTGVAVHLGSVRDLAGVILYAPFTSTVDVARRAAPLVPVGLLLRHRMDNLSLAPRLTMPALIVHGRGDAMYPARHALLLSEAWGGESDFVMYDTRAHDDLLEEERAWEKVEEFLAP